MLSTGDEIYLKVLFGQAGKTSTSELVCLSKFYADRSAIEKIDLTAAMTMPTYIEVFPRKSFASSKIKDHMTCPER